jgi:hypothetical protein
VSGVRRVGRRGGAAAVALAVAAAGAGVGAAGCGGRRSEAATALRPAPAIALSPVPADNLCVTHGTMEKQGGEGATGVAVKISEPATRAYALGSSGEAAALRFTYGGRTEQSSALKSGQVRRQLGLKLRAADGCNLVYVMWRIEPKPGLEVSVKRSPGKHTGEECGNEGYTKVKAQKSKLLPFLKFGEPHTLQAELSGDVLAVWLDGDNVWQGRLDASAEGLVGLAGLRTDNVQLQAELMAAPADPQAPTPDVPGCPKAPKPLPAPTATATPAAPVSPAPATK